MQSCINDDICGFCITDKFKSCAEGNINFDGCKNGKWIHKSKNNDNFCQINFLKGEDQLNTKSQKREWENEIPIVIVEKNNFVRLMREENGMVPKIEEIEKVSLI